MPTIKETLDAATRAFNELNISIGRAQVCLDKNIIEEPSLTNITDALNDIDAIVTSIFGSDSEASLLGALKDKRQLLDDSIA